MLRTEKKNSLRNVKDKDTVWEMVTSVKKRGANQGKLGIMI